MTTANRPELLKDRAYRELLEMIQSGVIAADSSVSERQLVERLGMSKTPIRAALENLQMQGLVTVSPQQGIFIKELSAREIGDLFDVRQAVEPFIAARLAIRTLAREQIDALKKNLAHQRTAVRKEDSLAATQLDIEFHRMLGRFFDNQEINAWLEKCFNKLQRSVLRINRMVPGRLFKSTEDHAEIADSIREGRSELAAQRMQDHLRYGARFLMGIE